nr:P-loop NTPase fold protein [uncultured Treponema sp.]
MRKILSIAVISAILSALLFLSVDIGFYPYIIISGLLIIFFSINYCICKNKKFYRTFLLIDIINIIEFLAKKYFDGFRFCFDIQDKVYIGYFITLFIILGITFADSFNSTKAKYENLFSERKYDLDRLINYLQQFNTVGINAHWGDGKSYLFKLFQDKSKDQYYFINIGVLSVTVDTIEKFVVDEINHILEENGIYSSASSKIKDFVKQPVFHDLGNLFVDSNSYTELFDTLLKDVQRLKKTIVITFEDIDRIKSTETIYKIFALADKLASENIKILYQYDENELLKILQVKKLYLEKYIPYTIELTQIKFERIIAVFLKNNKYKNICYKDFEFLTLRTIFIPWQIQKKLGINFNLELDIFGFSIRKIQIFLEEVNNALENELFIDYKRQIITFFFIKHFMYHIFEKLSIEDTFIDSCKFIYKKKNYTIYELFNDFESGELKDNDILSVFKNTQNRDILALICFFDYKFSWSPKVDNEQNTDKVYINQTEEVSSIKDNQNNEKIDRLIWNLLCNGKSEYTDFEEAVKLMKELVLNLPIEKQEEGYSNFWNKLSNGEFDKFDNMTVFRFGVADAYPIFQAFRIYEQDAEVWKRLIDFYLTHNKIKNINSSLLQVFKYCLISNKEVYFYVLKKFNKLVITGNMNDTKSYRSFFISYTEAFSNLGYINTRELNYISEDVLHKFDVEFVKKEVIQKFIQDFNELYKRIPLEQAKNEILLMIAFLEKNIKLIEAENTLEEFKGGIKSEMSMELSTDKIIKELKEKNLTEKQLLETLKEGYEKGKYSAHEVATVWNELKDK